MFDMTRLSGSYVGHSGTVIHVWHEPLVKPQQRPRAPAGACGLPPIRTTSGLALTLVAPTCTHSPRRAPRSLRCLQLPLMPDTLPVSFPQRPNGHAHSPDARPFATPRVFLLLCCPPTDALDFRDIVKLCQRAVVLAARAVTLLAFVLVPLWLLALWVLATNVSWQDLLAGARLRPLLTSPCASCMLLSGCCATLASNGPELAALTFSRTSVVTPCTRLTSPGARSARFGAPHACAL